MSDTPQNESNDRMMGLVNQAKAGLISARDFVHENTKPSDEEAADRAADPELPTGAKKESLAEAASKLAKDSLSKTKFALHDVTKPRSEEETKQYWKDHAERIRKGLPQSATEAGSKLGAVVDQALIAAQEKLSKNKSPRSCEEDTSEEDVETKSEEEKKGLRSKLPKSATEAGTLVGNLVDQGIAKAGEIIHKSKGSKTDTEMDSDAVALEKEM